VGANAPSCPPLGAHEQYRIVCNSVLFFIFYFLSTTLFAVLISNISVSKRPIRFTQFYTIFLPTVVSTVACRTRRRLTMWCCNIFIIIIIIRIERIDRITAADVIVRSLYGTTKNQRRATDLPVFSHRHAQTCISRGSYNIFGPYLNKTCCVGIFNKL
jgi:hypothetical protein